MYIGDLIKIYRKEHGLSMQDFSNLSGISKAYIGVLEKIYNPITKEPVAPSLPKVRAIATAMGMELDDLLKMLDTNQPVIINTKSPQSRPQMLAGDEEDLLNGYRKLDIADRAEIRGEIKGMLRSDKYRSKIKENTAG